MTLKMSVRYDHKALKPNRYGATYDPESTIIVLVSGRMPNNLLKVTCQSAPFRDIVIGRALLLDEPNIILEVLGHELATIQDINSAEDVALIEYMAGISGSLGEIGIFKDVLLRIEPKKVTPFIKSMYSAILSPETHTPGMLKNSLIKNAAFADSSWAAQAPNIQY